MKRKALHKDFFMEIKKTRNRYISLVLIVMLGVAFFSGVRAADPDMRLSADKYYDETNLMDIRVLSTLGLTDDDVEAICQVAGVKDVMPSYSMDVLCDLEDKQIVLKLMSSPDTVNQIEVVEGRMPESADECLVDTNLLASTDFEIGDTIEIHSGPEEDLSDSLVTDTLTIVGSGNTSYYLSLERGSSSLGSGSIHSFVVVPKDTFSLEVYTEIYLTAQGASDMTAYSDIYDDWIDEVVDHIEAIADARCQIRYDDIYNEAMEQIADAETEIEDARRQMEDARLKIEDAEKELADAEKELEDGEKKLADSEKELSDGWSEVSQQESKLSSSQSQINSGWSTIQSSKNELSEGKKQLEAAKQELTAAYSELEAAKSQLSQQEQAVAASETQLQESRQMLAGLKQMLENGDESVVPQIDALEAAIARGESEIASGKVLIEQGWAQVTNSQTALTAAQAEITERETQIAEAEAKIKSSESQLNSSQSQINSGWSQIASAKQTLADGEKELEEGRQELEDGRKELEEARITLSDARREYEDAVEENEPKIEEAEVEIADAKEALEDLDVPEWYVLSRQYLQTYVEYGQNADRIGAIGTVFPLIFFLVAALVCLTTMTRMVEEQRTQIGTLKALGYSKASIALKYILYALSASLLGSLIGLYLGQKLLPVVIIEAYKILYNNLPEIVTPLNASYSVSSTLAAVLCTTVAAVFACYKELAAVPAQLMRPAAPKSGKRVFLERLTIVWKRLNFSHKATIRNLIRYKKRFFMTVFGIGGCMALLLVGFGLKDSISQIGRLQYANVRLYDSILTIDDEADDEDRELLLAIIEADERIEKALFAEEKSVDAAVGSTTKSAYLMVPENRSVLRDFVSLQNRVNGEQYEIEDSGVVISEKLAVLLNVNVGETINLKDGDTDQFEVEVTAITENYFFHYIYMSAELYTQLYGEEPAFNELFTVNAADDEAFETQFATDYLDQDIVVGISMTSAMAESIQDMLKSMDIIIYVLVISAGLLAFIVLYNLNNINVSERMRELATLKVLGFYDQEVTAYVFRENIWLTLIGSLAGLILGRVLHQYVILTAEVDMTMFGRNIEVPSYIYSILLTFLFSAVVNVVMHFKLKKVNMVESMKSVE